MPNLSKLAKVIAQGRSALKKGSKGPLGVDDILKLTGHKTKPKKSVKKISEDLKEFLRKQGPLVGVGGAAVGVADWLGPDEALAGAGVFKAGKAATGVVSSALQRVKGMKVQGKTITDLRKGTGNWRTLYFDDGTQMTVEKTYVHDLSRARGREVYVDKFREASPDAKTTQALKSMKIHEGKVGRSFFIRSDTKKFHKQHLKRLSEFGEVLDPNTVFVLRENKYFQMPEDYAKHLQDLGVLTIMK